MGSLAGKSILFIGPEFYDYTRHLLKTLAEAGALVTFLTERPHSGLAYRLLRRTTTAGLRQYCNFFLSKRLTRLSGPFDLVFLLHGETTSPNLLNGLRVRWPQARFVYYTWDSVAVNPHSLRIQPCFDVSFSFDSADCARYPQFRYQPMFLLPAFEQPTDSRKPDTDLLFIGNDHSDRADVLRHLARQTRLEGRTLRIRLLTSTWKARLRRWRGDERAPFYMTQPLGLEQVRSEMSRARALLDIHNPNQSGLTQRTFEALALGLKLVTTNPHVRQEVFFDPDRILIIDRKAPRVDFDWLLRPAVPADLRAYRLSAWVERVLGSSVSEFSALKAGE